MKYSSNQQLCCQSGMNICLDSQHRLKNKMKKHPGGRDMNDIDEGRNGGVQPSHILYSNPDVSDVDLQVAYIKYSIICAWQNLFIFLSRNCLFQLLYIILVALGHLVLVVDGLPYLYATHPNTNHLLEPVTLLVINTVLFIVCCKTDAGVINEKNLDHYSDVFQADGVMYKKGNECRTCHVIKPARSKHCGKLNFFVLSLPLHDFFMPLPLGSGGIMFSGVVHLSIHPTNFYPGAPPVHLSGEVFRHFVENTWKEWHEIWYADVSWPLLELITFWS